MLVFSHVMVLEENFRRYEMILSTYCEVWVVADQVVHQGSAADVGWSWLYLVIPLVACLPER